MKSKHVNINGHLILWYTDDNEPVTLGVNPQLLPVFSTKDKLNEAKKWMGVAKFPTRIEKIDNGPEFLDSINEKVIIAIDPRILPDGKTDFIPARLALDKK